ncbi:hypothetical protein HK405_003084, partial [Cladochytrium tenue]
MGDVEWMMLEGKISELQSDIDSFRLISHQDVAPESFTNTVNMQWLLCKYTKEAMDRLISKMTTPDPTPDRSWLGRVASLLSLTHGGGASAVSNLASLDWRGVSSAIRKVAVPARALGVLETIKALLAGGAQPGAEDTRGRNILDYFFLIASREYDHGPWAQPALRIALSLLVGVETRPPLAFGPDATVPETTEFFASRRFLWPADLDVAGKFTKVTALYSAVLHLRDPVLVRILLAAGATPSRATVFSRKPNRRRPRNWSLLHRAARKGDLGAARLIAASPELLAACIDVKGEQPSVQAEFRRAAADAIAEGDFKRLRAILALCRRFRSWRHADIARSLGVIIDSPVFETVFDCVDSDDALSGVATKRIQFTTSAWYAGSSVAKEMGYNARQTRQSHKQRLNYHITLLCSTSIMASSAPAPPPPRRPPPSLPAWMWEQVLVTAADGDVRALFHASLVSRAVHCAVWAASPVAIARTLRRMLLACSPKLQFVAPILLLEVCVVMIWMEILPLDQFLGVLALLVAPPASFGAPVLTPEKHGNAAWMGYKRLPLWTSMRAAASVLRVFSCAGFLLNLQGTNVEQLYVPFAEDFYRKVGMSIAFSERPFGMNIKLAESDLDPSSDYSISALIQSYKDWGRIQEFAVGATRTAEMHVVRGLIRTAAVDSHQLLNLAAASGHVFVAEFILTRLGVDVDKCYDGYNPLASALDALEFTGKKAFTRSIGAVIGDFEWMMLACKISELQDDIDSFRQISHLDVAPESFTSTANMQWLLCKFTKEAMDRLISKMTTPDPTPDRSWLGRVASLLSLTHGGGASAVSNLASLDWRGVSSTIKEVAVPAHALGVLETIKALLAGGAQPGVEDTRGRNALDYFFLIAGREYDHGPWAQPALRIALSLLVGVETRPPLAFVPDATVPETTEFFAARRFLCPAELHAAGKFTKVTALYSAVLHLRDPVLVRILLAAGATPSRATLFSRKPNRRRPRNWSLLHRAARKSDLGAAQLIAAIPELLAACIDVKGEQPSVQAEFRRAAADAIEAGDIKRLRAILWLCGRFRSWRHTDIARSLGVIVDSPVFEKVFDCVGSDDLLSG